MLYLIFRLGGDHYAMAVDQIAQVLPVLQLKALPGVAPFVAGLCNYHGQPVPVIDLSALVTGLPAARHWGTRLILVRHPDDHRSDRLLGLLAEEATELLRLDDDDFSDAGARSDGMPYLGQVASTERGLVQRVNTTVLLPPDVRERLFCASEEPSW